MKVIVDTSVWSLALRRSKDVESEYVEELEELIKEVRVQLIGPVRQDNDFINFQSVISIELHKIRI